MYRKFLKGYLAHTALLLIAMAPLSISAEEAHLRAKDKENSELRIGMPLWATGTDGTIGVRGREGRVDDSFSDILDILEFTAAFNLEYRRNRWTFFATGLYLKTSQEAEPQGGLLGNLGSLEIDQVQIGGDFALGYIVAERENFHLGLYGGGRITYIDAELNLQLGPTQREFSGSEFWIDPIIGSRLEYRFSNPIGVYVKGDIGGFGIVSDFTWQVEGGFDFQLSRHTYLRLAYRYLGMDYSDDGFTFDVDTSGPLLEFGLRF